VDPLVGSLVSFPQSGDPAARPSFRRDPIFLFATFLFFFKSYPLKTSILRRSIFSYESHPSPLPSSPFPGIDNGFFFFVPFIFLFDPPSTKKSCQSHSPSLPPQTREDHFPSGFHRSFRLICSPLAYSSSPLGDTSRFPETPLPPPNRAVFSLPFRRAHSTPVSFFHTKASGIYPRLHRHFPSAVQPRFLVARTVTQ